MASSPGKHFSFTRESSDSDAGSMQFVSLQTEINLLKSQNEGLRSKCHKHKEKIKKYSKQLHEKGEALKSKDIQIDSLQLKVASLTIDNNNPILPLENTSLIETLKTEVKTKNNEIENLQQAFNELSLQIEQINSDLMNESIIKSRLLDLIQKQNVVIMKYEQETEDLKLQNNNLIKKIKQINTAASQTKDKEINYIINELNQQFLDNPALQTIIEDKSYDDTQKILMLFNHFNMNKEIKVEDNHQSNNEQNIRLQTYLSSVYNFLEKLANSGEIQDWLIGSNEEIDLKTKIYSQCYRIESFVKENSIINLIDSNVEFFDFANYADRIVNAIDGIDNQEVLLLFQGSSLANDLLRKYAQIVQDQLKFQHSELKRLRFELKETNKTIDDQSEIIKLDSSHDNILVEKVQEYEKLIQELDEKLQNGEGEIVNRCLEIIHGDSYEDYKKEPKIELARDFQAHVLELETSQDMLINKINKLGAKLEKSKIIIQDLSEENLILQKNKELLQHKDDEIRLLTQDLKDQKQQYLDQIKETEHQLADLEAQYHEDLKFYNEEKNDLQVQLQNSIKEVKDQEKVVRNQLKSEIKKLKEQILLRTKRSDEIKIFYEKMSLDMKTQIEEARKLERESREAKADFEKENQKLKSELSSLRINYRMLEMKIGSLSEKFQREKGLTESQNKIKLLSQETDLKNEIDKLRARMLEEKNQILFEICQKLGENDEYEVSLDVIFQMIEKMKEKVQNVQTLHIVQKENQEIKFVLGINSSDDAISEIKKLKEQAQSVNVAKDQVQKATKILRQAKITSQNNKVANEWEQWARRLHSLFTDSYSTAATVKELRCGLEDVLMSAIGERQPYRKLEILRKEKHILTSGFNLNKCRGKIKFSSLIDVLICTHRLQKLAGILQTDVLFDNSRSREEVEYPRAKSVDESDISKKSFPILSFMSDEY